MATSLQNLVCDNSTLANFKAWAQAISTFIGTTAGWSQSSDTGQVNWSTIVSAPGSGAYVYEIWQPNDGLQNFYLKIEYGNLSGQTNNPTIRLSMGYQTNGAGSFVGSSIGPVSTNNSSFTAPGASVPYECRMAGGAGYFSILMWRNGPNGIPQYIGVERSLNASGVYTSTHVTLITSGWMNSSSFQPCWQQSIVYGNTLVPVAQSVPYGNPDAGLACYYVQANRDGSYYNTLFNGNIGFSTTAPYVGFYDYPLTIVGMGSRYNFVEGLVFTANVYGNSHTYISTVGGALPQSAIASNWNHSFIARFD